MRYGWTSRESRRIALPRFDPEAFGRWSEAIARFLGTARFLVYMTVVILIWIGWNTLAPRDWRFDPYTFTFLTLMLSLQASYAAPLILLAQNRQADRDRLALEEDRRRAAVQKADTEYLAREIAALRIALGRGRHPRLPPGRAQPAQRGDGVGRARQPVITRRTPRAAQGDPEGARAGWPGGTRQPRDGRPSPRND